MEFNYDLIDNIEIDGVDTNDYPDFVDAYIASADYNGVPMTSTELDDLNEDSGYVYERVLSSIF